MPAPFSGCRWGQDSVSAQPLDDLLGCNPRPCASSAISVRTSGSALRLCHCGCSSEPLLEATRGYALPSVTRITGFFRSLPLFAPRVVTTTTGYWCPATCWPPDHWSVHTPRPVAHPLLRARLVLFAQRHVARRCGQPLTPAAGYSGARTGVSWCSDSPRKNGFCSWRRAIKNMIGRPRTIEPMPSRNTLPISTLVPGMVQPPR